MPKATLEFNLPEEIQEFETAANGWKFKVALWQYDQHLRGLVKYGTEEEQKEFSAQVARDLLWKMLREEGIEEID